jgi:hypothetical protein
MASSFKASTIAVAAAAAAIGVLATLAVTRTGSQSSPAAASVVRAADGKPDFSGIWQALNEAHWDLQAHEARPAAVMQQGVYPYEYARVPAAPVLALGAAAGVPGSVGFVEDDGKIPQGRQRIIPITAAPHLPGNVRLWWGDSRGRWEGNTLVVDVTNFSPKSNF